MEGLQALVSLFHRSLLPLVVIHYLNIVDISLFPTEADSPLSVDPNEVITIHIYTYAQMM